MRRLTLLTAALCLLAAPADALEASEVNDEAIARIVNMAHGTFYMLGAYIAYTFAEKAGGVECYLVEQEGSRFSPFETAEKCLVSFKKMRG